MKQKEFRDEQKPQYRLRNWSQYNRSLVQRGSITFWLDEESLKNWFERQPSGKRGRPPTYSDLAIQISKTFVAVDDEQTTLTKKEVLGFYTLSTGQINFEALPKGVKHPRYPVSIARLARLAVDLKHQGKEVGGFLLYDALQKIKIVSQTIGIFAVVVDAKDVKAKSFYEKYGFVSWQETDLTLCLPLKVLDKL